MDSIKNIREEIDSLSVFAIDLELQIIGLQVTQNKINTQLELLAARLSEVEISEIETSEIEKEEEKAQE